MSALSDISLNGTVVSWVSNDDTSFDVSCTYEDGSGFVFSGVTNSFFELLGVMDITRNIDVVVTGTPSNASLSISYSSWVFTRISGGPLDLVSNGNVKSIITIDGVLYAGGLNITTGAPFVISYDSSNQVWTNLSEGALGFISNGDVEALTEVSGGLYAGGWITGAAPFVMSYDSSTQVWTNLIGGEFSADDRVYTLTAIGNTLYVGGTNDETGAIIIKSYDGFAKRWTNLSGGELGLISNGAVYSFTEVSGVLYAGGQNFTNSYPNQPPFVMSYDGSTWTNLSGGDLDFVSNGIVKALTEVSGVLYAGGRDDTSSPPTPFVMSYDSSNQVWTNLSGGALGFISNGVVDSLTEVSGVLYAGGQNNTNNRPFVMSYDSSTHEWTNLTGGYLDTFGTGYVNSLTEVNGFLYAGGYTSNPGIPYVMSYGPPPPPPSPTPLSDISLNGTILTWASNDDTTIVMTITMNGAEVFFSATESSPFDLSGNVDTTQVLSIVLTGTPSSASLNVQYNPPQPPSPPPVQVPCFLENAPVLTPSGYKKISKLVAGDLVITGDGRSVPIQSVARKHVAAGPSTNPYVIPKGLYGATKRLLISPNHCVATSKGMVEARLLGLEQEDMTGSIHYYNLELPSWAKDTMVVAGVTVESLAPVRRVRLSIDQFKAKLVRQYGKITPEILAKVERTCRIVDGGYVEFPALIRKDTESNPTTFTK